MYRVISLAKCLLCTEGVPYPWRCGWVVPILGAVTGGYFDEGDVTCKANYFVTDLSTDDRSSAVSVRFF